MEPKSEVSKDSSFRLQLGRRRWATDGSSWNVSKDFVEQGFNWAVAVGPRMDLLPYPVRFP